MNNDKKKFDLLPSWLAYSKIISFESVGNVDDIRRRRSTLHNVDALSTMNEWIGGGVKICQLAGNETTNCHYL